VAQAGAVQRHRDHGVRARPIAGALRHQLRQQGTGGEIAVELETRQQAIERRGIDEARVDPVERRRAAASAQGGLAPQAIATDLS